MAQIFNDNGLDLFLGQFPKGATQLTTTYLELFTSQTASTVIAHTASGTTITETSYTSYARQALAAAPGHARTHRNFAVLLDLYLWRPVEALQHFETYVAMSGTADRQVSGWIAELKRRVGDVAQTAGVHP